METQHERAVVSSVHAIHDISTTAVWQRRLTSPRNCNDGPCEFTGRDRCNVGFVVGCYLVKRAVRPRVISQAITTFILSLFASQRYETRAIARIIECRVFRRQINESSGGKAAGSITNRFHVQSAAIVLRISMQIYVFTNTNIYRIFVQFGVRLFYA